MNDLHWTEDLDVLPRTVEHLETNLAIYRNLDKVILRLYYGRPISTPTMDVTRPSAALAMADSARSSSGFSLVREVVDAAASLVVRTPAVKCQPVGARFSRQRGSRLMSRYLNGVFYANDIEALSRRMFVDACTCRVGAIKWFVDDKREIKAERLNPLWLVWDESEGNVPRHLYYAAPVARRFLISQYPEKATDLANVPRWEPSLVPWIDLAGMRDADRVKVIEAWSLPEGDKAGRHVIMAGDVVLFEEKWRHSRFPVVAYRWSPSWSSWGGRPLGEILIPYQTWTNKLMRVIAEAQRGAVPKLLLHENAEMGQLADKNWEHVIWHGAIPPQFVTPQALTPEIYSWREALKKEAYEEAGVSMSLAQGTKPPGLTSGVAQREHQDIASMRLLLQTQTFEAAFKESAQVVVMLASEAYKTRSARVLAPGTELLDEIDWQDIDLKEDEYSIQVQTVSSLPLTVSGRLDFVSDLLTQQLIDKKVGLRLLRMPDTEEYLDREEAQQDLADKQVEQALWEGNYLPPETVQDLDLLLKTASDQLSQALVNGTFPELNLELCRRLIAEVKVLKAPPPQPPAAAPSAAPAPGGEAPPPAPPPGAPPAPPPQ